MKQRADLRLAALIIGAGVVALGCSASLAAQTQIKKHTYDALGRLIVTETSGGSADGETGSICYDKAGNRTVYTATSIGLEEGCADVGGEPPTPPQSTAPKFRVVFNGRFFVQRLP